MKIHRVVQMLGATTSTGKLADDMYDLGHKDYYSEAQDRYIPISHMDFQHMVRAFVKQNDEDVRTDTQEGKVKELKQSLDSSHRAYKMGFERNGRHIEEIKKLEDIIESNDRIYKKNLAELQERYDTCRRHRDDLQKKYDELNVIGIHDGVWKERYEHELKNAEFWKDTYYNNQPKGCGYVFSEIPNDTDGQEFVDNMKQYFNKKTYKMRVRGQHIKPELKGTGATYWGQSKDESTHMRVYIDNKK